MKRWGRLAWHGLVCQYTIAKKKKKVIWFKLREWKEVEKNLNNIGKSSKKLKCYLRKWRNMIFGYLFFYVFFDRMTKKNTCGWSITDHKVLGIRFFFIIDFSVLEEQMREICRFRLGSMNNHFLYLLLQVFWRKKKFWAWSMSRMKVGKYFQDVCLMHSYKIS